MLLRDTLIRKRDRTSDIGKYSALDTQVKALRAEMAPKREPVLTEPDDISQFDFTVVRPKQQPRKSPSKTRPAAGTRQAPTTITESMQAYIRMFTVYKFASIIRGLPCTTEIIHLHLHPPGALQRLQLFY
jgi:hypothetical protein